MATALTGPAADLGTSVRAGFEAAFAECNRAGGVRGRPITLVVRDDAYEPSRTAGCIRTLLDQDKALAVVGDVGTPTAVAALPVCAERSTVFFAGFTGSGLLRKDPPDDLVISLRASYAEETRAMVEALLKHAGLTPSEVAFFTQRDAYGDSGYNGGIAALRENGLKDEASVAHGRYERNTTNVESGLADILSATTTPKAVIMVGTYAPCARFLTLAREAGLDAVFLSVSFVGAEALAKEGGAASEGVLVTEVVPHPESALPAAKAFRAALAASDPAARPNHAAFEGYLAGRTLILALQHAPADPTRDSIAPALLGLGEFDLGIGVTLRLGGGEHQASHTVWPSMIRGGRVVDIEWSALAGKGPPK
jgi:ABC-type branched-subunit amino acid transport system substrate-binding protein